MLWYSTPYRSSSFPHCSSFVYCIIEDSRNEDDEIATGVTLGANYTGICAISTSTNNKQQPPFAFDELELRRTRVLNPRRVVISHLTSHDWLQLEQVYAL
jgi:hypothetical protein